MTNQFEEKEKLKEIRFNLMLYYSCNDMYIHTHVMCIQAFPSKSLKHTRKCRKQHVTGNGEVQQRVLLSPCRFPDSVSLHRVLILH